MEKAYIVVFSIFAFLGGILLLGSFHSGEPMFVLVGTIFSCLGWGVIIFFSRKLYIQSRVQQNGIALSTEFVGIIADNFTKGNEQQNKKSNYVVRTKWLDEENNILYYFSSNTLWYNPKKELKDVKYITVLVNPKNFYHNYMDLSFLPKRLN